LAGTARAQGDLAVPASRNWRGLRANKGTPVLVVALERARRFTCDSQSVAAMLNESVSPAPPAVRAQGRGDLAVCKVTGAAGALAAAAGYQPGEGSRVESRARSGEIGSEGLPHLEAIARDAKQGEAAIEARAVLAKPKATASGGRNARFAVTPVEESAPVKAPASVAARSRLAAPAVKPVEKPAAAVTAPVPPPHLPAAPTRPPQPPRRTRRSPRPQARWSSRTRRRRRPNPRPHRNPPSPRNHRRPKPRPMAPCWRSRPRWWRAACGAGTVVARTAEQYERVIAGWLGRAVIGGGTAWGLTHFGLRPSPSQALWFTNSTAWGTLAGLMTWAGTGSDNVKLKWACWSAANPSAWAWACSARANGIGPHRRFSSPIVSFLGLGSPAGRAAARAPRGAVPGHAAHRLWNRARHGRRWAAQSLCQCVEKRPAPARRLRRRQRLVGGPAGLRPGHGSGHAQRSSRRRVPGGNGRGLSGRGPALAFR